MVDDLWYYKLKERKKNLIQHLYTPLGQKFYSRFFRFCPKNTQNSTVCKIALLTLGFMFYEDIWLKFLHWPSNILIVFGISYEWCIYTVALVDVAKAASH